MISRNWNAEELREIALAADKLPALLQGLVDMIEVRGASTVRLPLGKVIDAVERSVLAADMLQQVLDGINGANRECRGLFDAEHTSAKEGEGKPNPLLRRLRRSVSPRSEWSGAAVVR